MFLPTSAQSPAMTAFFEEVSAVKKSMQTIKYNIKLLLAYARWERLKV